MRQCSESFFANRTRPCLQHQIGRCSAPCVELVSPADYRRDVDDAILFIQGRNVAVLDSLMNRMESGRSEPGLRTRSGHPRPDRIDPPPG